MTTVGLAASSLLVSLIAACSISALPPPPSSEDATGDAGVIPVATADAALDLTACRDGETLTVFGLYRLCCAGSAPLLCRNPGPRIGDPCTTVQPQSRVVEANLTPEECDTAVCTGPEIKGQIFSKSVVVTTPVACDSGVLTASGAERTHVIEMVCAPLAQGCGPDPESTDGSFITITAHIEGVALSVCSTDGDAPTPCDVNTL